MTCIVATHYRYTRLPRTAASGRALIAVALLAGCVADGRPSDQELRRADANHQDGASGATTPQAVYAATHGVWLWPPAERTNR
jgi:hypothetical protein